MTIRTLVDDDVMTYLIADTWVDTIVFVNSSINPFIYCYGMEEFRFAFLRLIGRDQVARMEVYAKKQDYGANDNAH